MQPLPRAIRGFPTAQSRAILNPPGTTTNSSSSAPAPSAAPIPTPIPATAPAPRQQQQQRRDVRHLTINERLELVQGLEVTVMTGNQVTCKLPLRLFRATSTKAHLIDFSDPTTPKYLAFHISMNPAPFNYLADYLRKMADQQRVPQLKRLEDNLKDLTVIRAGKCMGMDHYVQHIFNYYWAAYTNDDLRLQDIENVLRVATETEMNSFFKLVAERIAHDQYYGRVQDLGKLRQYLAGKPALRNVVQDELNQFRASNGRGKLRNSGRGWILGSQASS